MDIKRVISVYFCNTCNLISILVSTLYPFSYPYQYKKCLSNTYLLVQAPIDSLNESATKTKKKIQSEVSICYCANNVWYNFWSFIFYNRIRSDNPEWCSSNRLMMEMTISRREDIFIHRWMNVESFKPITITSMDLWVTLGVWASPNPLNSFQWKCVKPTYPLINIYGNEGHPHSHAYSFGSPVGCQCSQKPFFMWSCWHFIPNTYHFCGAVVILHQTLAALVGLSGTNMSTDTLRVGISASHIQQN